MNGQGKAGRNFVIPDERRERERNVGGNNDGAALDLIDTLAEYGCEYG
jgi:hypothetical protein